MGQILHGSATTTEAVRRAIQHSQESLRGLAKRYGVNPKTVAKWKARSSVSDLPTGPKQPRSTVLSAEEEAVVVAFRSHTLLPLDDWLRARSARSADRAVMELKCMETCACRLNTCACRLVCCGSVTFGKKCSDPQLAVEATQRNPIGVIRVQSLKISSRFALRGTVILASARSETQETLTPELRNAATLSPAFDRDLAATIGTRVAVRRSLRGLSKLQLGVRLGIDTSDVSAYEQGEKRMSCKLLLETAKQLKASPRFFFQ